jgi:hypothetical protein
MSSPFQKKFCGKTPDPIKMLGDLNKDGKMSSYEQTRQAAIEANTDSPAKQIDSKTANIMADAASLEMRAKKRGISGKRQMQIDQENYGSTMEQLYRGEGPKKILGFTPEPQKFGGRDWEFETVVNIEGDKQRVPKYKSSALNQNKKKKKTSSTDVVQTSTIKNPKFKELSQKQKDSLHQKAIKLGKKFHSKELGVTVDPEDGVLSRMPNPNYKK